MSTEIFSSIPELIARATAIVTQAAARGQVALSGGSTPRPVYEAVAAAGVKGEWFQVDERCVPYDHPDSNAAMIERCGLRLERVRTELPPDEAAAAYEAVVRERLQSPALVLLGLGSDGHTASLFPDSPELDERERDVVATQEAHAGYRRVTMTLPLLARFERRVFLVAGAGKTEAVTRILCNGESLPGRLVTGALWLLDAEAAAGL